MIFKFDKEDFDWEYETGYEQSEILGSGSNYSNVFNSNSFEETLKAFKESGFNNYLIRRRMVKISEYTFPRRIEEYYDFKENKFIGI